MFRRVMLKRLEAARQEELSDQERVRRVNAMTLWVCPVCPSPVSALSHVRPLVRHCERCGDTFELKPAEYTIVKLSRSVEEKLADKLWEPGSSAFWLDPNLWCRSPIVQGRHEPCWMHLK